MAVAPNTVVITGMMILLRTVEVEEDSVIFDIPVRFGGDKLAYRGWQKNTPFEVLDRSIF